MTTSADPRREVAAAMAEAALTWIDMLTDEQRVVGLGAAPVDSDSDGERRRWFYTPTDHGGVTLHQQRPAQQRATMRLVASGLSTPGYVTVATTMGLENMLDQLEGFVATFARERGRDPGMYFLRVFGDPAGSAPWGWRFGGHHVSLNNLIVDGALVSSTPCFMGADPASSPLLGGAVNRPLGRVEDIARDIVRSLSPELAREAILLPKAPSDFVTGNRSVISDGDQLISLAGIFRDRRLADDAEQAKLQAMSDAIDERSGYSAADHEVMAYSSTPKGLPGSALDTEQQELMYSLLATYFDRVPAGISPLPSYDAAALSDLHIAWAGSTEVGEPNYYRVQGPGLLIEWDNTQRGANHAHSVWRDPANDFGMDVLAAHRAAHH